MPASAAVACGRFQPPLPSSSLPLSLSPSLSHPALSRVQLNILTICLRLHLSPAFLCHHFCHTCVYVCVCAGVGVHVCVCVCALVCLAFLSIWTHASLSLLNSLFLVFEIDLMLLFYLLCQPPPLRTPTLTAACKLQRATWLKKKNLANVSFPIDLYSATGTAACNFIQTLLHLFTLFPSSLFAETSCLP